MPIRTLAAALATAALLMGVGTAAADSSGQGKATRSRGQGSANTVQLPLDIPFNDCCSTINVGGFLNAVGRSKGTM
ncbi:chaplin [Streptomyces sp. NPDC001339]|uniref:chaplin n=1 Tax=Streptomyces sp. NPDC001339 TaxID=3364563 RepID=UPI00368BEA10